MLERQAPTKAEREIELLKTGYPAYTTSVGWIRILRRANPRALPRRARRRMDAFQGQGRRHGRRRCTLGSCVSAHRLRTAS